MDGRTAAQLGPRTHSCCALRAALRARPEPGGDRPRRRPAAPAGSPVGAPRALGARDSSGFAWQRPGPAELPPHRRPHREDRGLRALALQVQSKAGWREEGLGSRGTPTYTHPGTDPTEPSPHPHTHPSSPAVSGHPCVCWGAGESRPPWEGGTQLVCLPEHERGFSPTPSAPAPTQWGDTAWAGPAVPLCQAQVPAGSCQHSLGLLTRPFVSPSCSSLPMAPVGLGLPNWGSGGARVEEQWGRWGRRGQEVPGAE